MKKLLCLLLTFVMFFSLTACNTNTEVDDPASPSEIETKPSQELSGEQILNIVSSEVAPWTKYNEDEKLLYEEFYVPAFSEDEKAQNAMLENQSINTNIVVESCSEGVAVLKITSPDLGKLLVEITEKANLEYGEDTVIKVKRLIAEALTNGEFTTTEYVVEIEYKILDDGSMDIVETQEYYNALYGGIITLQEEIIKQLEEGENHE